MRLIRIFTANKLTGGASTELTGTAARHVAQVLRMGAGDSLLLFDGSGKEYPASIETASKSRVVVSLGESQVGTTESTLHTTLWHGLCRSGRMDHVVQKATELGVSAIQPVLTEHGVVRLDSARAGKKAAHWRQVAISACEQSGRTSVPVIHEIATLSECLENHRVNRNSATVAILFDPEGTPGIAQHLGAAHDFILLTGPEGGFSPAEKTTAIAAGFKLVALGPRILRTETAPVVALALLQSLAGDLAD